MDFQQSDVTEFTKIYVFHSFVTMLGQMKEHCFSAELHCCPEFLSAMVTELSAHAVAIEMLVDEFPSLWDKWQHASLQYWLNVMNNGG